VTKAQHQERSRTIIADRKGGPSRGSCSRAQNCYTKGEGNGPAARRKQSKEKGLRIESWNSSAGAGEKPHGRQTEQAGRERVEELQPPPTLRVERLRDGESHSYIMNKEARGEKDCRAKTTRTKENHFDQRGGKGNAKISD